MTRDEWIDRLVSDLTPVAAPPRPWRDVGVWLVLAWASTLLLTVLMGPFRAGAAAEWLASSRFQLETVVVALASVVTGALVARAAIPARGSARSPLLAALLLLGAWALLLAWAHAVPPFPLDMTGKRAACVLEVLADAALPCALGLWWLRRRYAVLAPGLVGAALGLAAGAIPAIVMQLACVYEPTHALRFHLGPVVICGLLGAVLGRVVLARRRGPVGERRAR